MQKVSYRRHRFHPDIIGQAVWLNFRFRMHYRDVENLLVESNQRQLGNDAFVGVEFRPSLCTPDQARPMQSKRSGFTTASVLSLRGWWAG
jgi:hypothetical protein